MKKAAKAKKPEIGDNSEEERERERQDLAIIADDIHAIDRKNTENYLKIGELLIKAKDACKHGLWHLWLELEFHWSTGTAENYMAAARLAGKFKTVQNLTTRVPLRILYQLGRNVDEPYVEAALEALAKLSKRPNEKMLSVTEAERAITLAKQRTRHGDLPEATLFALEDWDWTLDNCATATPYVHATHAKLKELKPETEEEAKRIKEAVRDEFFPKAAEDAAENKEIDDILDGPPPAVPPPADNVAPANFALQDFDKAIDTLKRLMTKPCGDFVSTSHEASELESVKEFIASVATAIGKINKAA